VTASRRRRSGRVDGLKWVAGSARLRHGRRFLLSEEGPVHDVTVAGFWIDEYAVANADFAAFVRATGYMTVAKRPLDPAAYPRADPELLKPGGSVGQRP